MDEVEDRAADASARGFQPRWRSRGRRDVGDAALRVDQQQRVGAVLDERAEPLLARAQRRFRLPPLLLFGVQRQRVADRALERLDREVRLAEIVGGAGLHRLDRDLFGAAAGEDDDRVVDAALADSRSRLRPSRAPEPVVEERDVEGLGRRTRAAPARTRRRSPSPRRATRRPSAGTRPPSRRARWHRRRPGRGAAIGIVRQRRKMPAILLPSAAEKPFDGARGPLLQRCRGGPGTARTAPVAVLEVLGIGRAALDRLQIRHAAQLFGVQPGGHRELARPAAGVPCAS